MVHDRIPRALYEHPIVEYIPLEVSSVATGPIPPAVRAAGAGVRPVLRVLCDDTAWKSAFSDHRYAFPSLDTLEPLGAPPAGRQPLGTDLAGRQPLGTDLAGRRDLILLAVGFRAAAGIYRDHKVSLATAAIGPVYHLFTLPLKYFYKSSIDFVAYTAFGARLAEARAVNVDNRAWARRRL